MRQIIISSICFVVIGLFISCSGTEEMTIQQGTKTEEKVQVPSWYPQQEFVSDESQLYAYATAIDSDSASSVQKALDWAKEELKSSVSDQLEEIRAKAMKELGSESGLDDPGFLMTLRKANSAVDPLVQTGKTGVRYVEGYESVRGFAEVFVPKDELIKRISKRLGEYEKTWNALKESDAFQDF